MSKSYLPALKDKDGNKIVGMMGQFDDENEAREKLLADFLFYIPFGLTTAGVVEFDKSIGLLNAPIDIQCGPLSGKFAVIEGPLFDEAVRRTADNASGQHTGEAT